jgi:hypothetical protein
VPTAHASVSVIVIDSDANVGRVPGPPIGVTRLGSPASPRIVLVDAAPAPVRPLPPPSSFFACPFCHVCSACMHVLTRVPGPPIGVTRLGSPASPRIVPVDAAACRAYRDPGSKPLRDRGLRGHLPAKANFVFVVLRHQAKSLAAAKTVAMRINIGPRRSLV